MFFLRGSLPSDTFEIGFPNHRQTFWHTCGRSSSKKAESARLLESTAFLLVACSAGMPEHVPHRDRFRHGLLHGNPAATSRYGNPRDDYRWSTTCNFEEPYARTAWRVPVCKWQALEMNFRHNGLRKHMQKRGAVARDVNVSSPRRIITAIAALIVQTQRAIYPKGFHEGMTSILNANTSSHRNYEL